MGRHPARRRNAFKKAGRIERRFCGHAENAVLPRWMTLILSCMDISIRPPIKIETMAPGRYFDIFGAGQRRNISGAGDGSAYSLKTGWWDDERQGRWLIGRRHDRGSLQRSPTGATASVRSPSARHEAARSSSTFTRIEHTHQVSFLFRCAAWWWQRWPVRWSLNAAKVFAASFTPSSARCSPARSTCLVGAAADGLCAAMLRQTWAAALHWRPSSPAPNALRQPGRPLD